MKRNLLLASVIAFSSLGVLVPNTLAQTVETTVDVPFAGVVGSNCVAVPTVPGVLVVDGNTLTSESSGVSGLMTVLCNQDFDLISKLPEETTLSPLTALDATGSSSSSITSTTDGTTVMNGVELSLAGAELHLIEVDMSVDYGSTIPAGAYTYEVPVDVVLP